MKTWCFPSVVGCLTIMGEWTLKMQQECIVQTLQGEQFLSQEEVDVERGKKLWGLDRLRYHAAHL